VRAGVKPAEDFALAPILQRRGPTSEECNTPAAQALVEALLLVVIVVAGLLIASVAVIRVICVVVLGWVIARLLLLVLGRVVCATGAARTSVRSRAAEAGRSALAHQGGSVNHALRKAARHRRGMVCGLGVSRMESRVAEGVAIFVARVAGVVESEVAVGVRGRVGLVSVLVVGVRCIRRFRRVVSLSAKCDREQDNDQKAKPLHNSFPTSTLNCGVVWTGCQWQSGVGKSMAGLDLGAIMSRRRQLWRE